MEVISCPCAVDIHITPIVQLETCHLTVHGIQSCNLIFSEVRDVAIVKL